MKRISNYHGTINGYTNHRCSCALCRAANNAYHKKRVRLIKTRKSLCTHVGKWRYLRLVNGLPCLRCTHCYTERMQHVEVKLKELALEVRGAY